MFPTPDDVNAIRGLILAQLDAFAADDAELAFSFASQLIRAHFGTAAVFLDMVREYYADVYRSRRVRFGSLRERSSDRSALQVVFLLDDGGNVVNVATYDLCREQAGWRIRGCVLTLSLPEPDQ
jgi:hypothetical protein